MGYRRYLARQEIYILCTRGIRKILRVRFVPTFSFFFCSFLCSLKYKFKSRLRQAPDNLLVEPEKALQEVKHEKEADRPERHGERQPDAEGDRDREGRDHEGPEERRGGAGALPGHAQNQRRAAGGRGGSFRHP